MNPNSSLNIIIERAIRDATWDATLNVIGGATLNATWDATRATVLSATYNATCDATRAILNEDEE